MVADMSDDDIWRLNRGGHDPHKVYAAYAAAVKHTGQPTVILAKTIKGYGMGEAGEGAEHHPPAEEDGHDVAARPSATASTFRSRTSKLDEIAVLPPAPKTAPEMKYMRERREALGGYLPQRRANGDTAARFRRCRPSKRC